MCDFAVGFSIENKPSCVVNIVKSEGPGSAL